MRYKARRMAAESFARTILASTAAAGAELESPDYTLPVAESLVRTANCSLGKDVLGILDAQAHTL